LGDGDFSPEEMEGWEEYENDDDPWMTEDEEEFANEEEKALWEQAQEQELDLEYEKQVSGQGCSCLRLRSIASYLSSRIICRYWSEESALC
jgi:hypothetical protein